MTVPPLRVVAKSERGDTRDALLHAVGGKKKSAGAANGITHGGRVTGARAGYGTVTTCVRVRGLIQQRAACAEIKTGPLGPGCLGSNPSLGSDPSTDP